MQLVLRYWAFLLHPQRICRRHFAQSPGGVDTCEQRGSESNDKRLDEMNRLKLHLQRPAKRTKVDNIDENRG